MSESPPIQVIQVTLRLDDAISRMQQTANQFLKVSRGPLFQEFLDLQQCTNDLTDIRLGAVPIETLLPKQDDPETPAPDVAPEAPKQ